MDEIKIWAVDESGATSVRASGVESEALLERTLVNNPELLLPGLKLVGRQTQTEGGPLDLLGVDDDGKLVVFELKKGTLTREAVAQVIDYTSYLDSLNDSGLAELISEKSGNLGIDKIHDFEDWYGQHGAGDGLESLRPIRTVLVGLGVDDTTERMVNFLAKNSGMDISLLTFYGFHDGNKTLLARQLRVGEPPPPQTPDEILLERARGYGVSDLFSDVLEMFRNTWDSPRRRVPRHMLGVNLRLRRRPESGRRSSRPAYARVDPSEGGIHVVFYPRAIDLCRQEFRPPIADIPFLTYPPNREHDPLGIPDTEIVFLLNAENWETHKQTLDGLAQAVYNSLQALNMGESASYIDDDDDG